MKISTFLLTLALALTGLPAMAQTDTESSTTETSSSATTKYCLLVSGYEGFYNSQGVEKAVYASSATTYAWKTLDVTDQAFYWKLTYSDGNNTFTATNCKYGSVITGFGTLAESGAATITPTKQSSGKYYLAVGSGSSNNLHAYGHNNGSGASGTLIGYGSGGACNWIIRDTVTTNAVTTLSNSCGKYWGRDLYEGEDNSYETAKNLIENFVTSSSTASSSYALMTEDFVKAVGYLKTSYGTNCFIRIKATSEALSNSSNGFSSDVNTNGLYLRAENVSSGTNGKGYALFGSGTTTDNQIDPMTIFYCSGTMETNVDTLLGFYNGYYLTDENNGVSTTYAKEKFNGIATPTPVTFPKSSITNASDNAYCITFNNTSRYIYLSSVESSNSTTGWGNYGGVPTTTDTRVDFEIEQVESLPITISAVGYATLCAPVDLAIPDGVYAYRGEIVDDESWSSGKSIKLTQISETIPARTPVLITNIDQSASATGTSSGSATTYRFSISDASASSSKDNAFTGTTATVANVSGAYALQNGTRGVAFYPYSGEMKGFHAYLTLPASMQAAALRFVFGDGQTTDVANALIYAGAKDKTIYDLQGRRVAKATKGIYVIDGKKVILK